MKEDTKQLICQKYLRSSLNPTVSHGPIRRSSLGGAPLSYRFWSENLPRSK